MVLVRTLSELNAVFPMHLRMYIRRQLQMLELSPPACCFNMGNVLIVDANDTPEQLEAAVQWPIFSAAHWEWCAYKGGFYEIALVTQDNGAFILVFVPINADIHQTVLAHCQLAA